MDGEKQKEYRRKQKKEKMSERTNVLTNFVKDWMEWQIVSARKNSRTVSFPLSSCSFSCLSVTSGFLSVTLSSLSSSEELSFDNDWSPYRADSMAHPVNSIMFCVSVPVLSLSTCVICPISSANAVLRAIAPCPCSRVFPFECSCDDDEDDDDDEGEDETDVIGGSARHR